MFQAIRTLLEVEKRLSLHPRTRLCPLFASTTQQKRYFTSYKRPFLHSASQPAPAHTCCFPINSASSKFVTIASVNMSSAVEAKKTSKLEFQRLPLNAVPVHYDITIKPNFDNFTFEGVENIDLKINETSPNIVMNAVELNILKAVWKDSGTGKEQVAQTISVDETTEIFTAAFQPPLQSGTGTILLEFTGSMNDKMKGFYRSKFKGSDGQDKYNGVTQFEATDARRAFPCFDEPSHKATFNISLVVEKNKTALSNMPVKEIQAYPEDDKLHVVKYERSPIMSTYLVAYCIGDFEYVETTSSDGVLCRVYTPPGKKNQGKFALSVTAKVLPYYKEYFGIAYPLPKLDLIAIADFSAGAMENWGLITYRETCLLVDEEETSATSRQWIALVVGHEIAHQWFGNYVTMEWWTHLWLNEGYASFVEFLCVDFLFPEYDIWTQFVTDTFVRALELDSLKNSHPIEVPVGHPREVDEIFDDISYSKGASIIRMLHRYIGDADFRKGMNIYLTRHQYKNTFTEDLWRSLEEASGKPIGQVMGTWTKQMGFPLIRVQSEQNGDTRVMRLTQEKYWADPNLKNSKEHNDYSWMVPVAFCSASDPNTPICQTLMEEKMVTVELPGIRSDEWVKLNPGAVGFYRVRYPPELLVEFLPAIKNKILPPLDRIGLLDDLFAMVQSGESSTVLRTLDAFKNEDNFTVWSSISNVMSKLNLLFAYTDYHDQFKKFGIHLFSGIADSVGWEPKEGESHLDTMLRSLVLLRLTSFGHEKTIQESKRRLNLHRNGDQTIPADLRPVVYRGVISEGDEETLEMMLKMYRESDMLEEQDRIGRSLGLAKNLNVLKKVLEFAISEDVRSQDTVFIMISVGMNKVGRPLAWNFFKENKKFLGERYPSGGLIARLVKHLCENFVTEEDARSVTEFFAENPFAGTERTVQQVVESIRLNEQWLKRDERLVGEFLTNAI
ncbi:Puromycin-sensitive aminopeptidase [Folsomia candida]|uniref:Aminopeptidase n=1 Tax=Folsomia candida TaxID=158441 RepID=A0A226F650_FOLCA|nr:Puromycin-sensitive aminopeptidase [Folsomia candida]